MRLLLRAISGRGRPETTKGRSRPQTVILAGFFCLAICSRVFGLATNQLYTGDATTVPVGKVQAQAYYDSSFGGSQRVAGGSLSIGATQRMDVRLGYGYLWNDVGPDFRLGPNAGLKWRAIGDGARKPSIAISCVGAINNGSGGQSHKNDYGAVLIGQFWTKPITYLVNFGHVWVGDANTPDLRYLGFAAVHNLSPHALTALEYSALERISGTQTNANDQIAAAFVYAARNGLSYSAQLAYLPFGRNTRTHLTLGISTYL